MKPGPASSADRFNRLTAEVIAWLDDQPDVDRLAACLRQWSPADWQMAERVCLVQGIAAYLHRALPAGPLSALLPAEFHQWLAWQYQQNQRRIQRIHGDLGRLLHAAQAAGLAVMPLKGSALTTRFIPDPAVRPMADIDILAHPADRAALRRVLEGLGYRFVPTRNEYANHDVYHQPGDTTIADKTSEHPDNPCPVEVHYELRRCAWGNIESYDLTRFMWEGSQIGPLLSAQAWLPRPEHMLVYLAVHATHHQLYCTGRLIHWLDLACLAGHGYALPGVDYPAVTYPALRLARRALPVKCQSLSLDELAAAVSPALRAWCETVPLDRRCGLYGETAQLSKAGLRLRWERWGLAPWRMAIVYGQMPLAQAYGRHLIAAGQWALKRARALALERLGAAPSGDQGQPAGAH